MRLALRVVIAKHYVERISRSVEYVGVDTTIMGSRNAPSFITYALHTLGREGMTAIVDTSIERADYAIEAFLQAGIHAWRHDNSPTVVIPRPADSVLAKWQIAPYRDIGHIITLPHVSEQQIDQVVEDIRSTQ